MPSLEEIQLIQADLITALTTMESELLGPSTDGEFRGLDICIRTPDGIVMEIHKVRFLKSLVLFSGYGIDGAKDMVQAYLYSNFHPVFQLIRRQRLLRPSIEFDSLGE